MTGISKRRAVQKGRIRHLRPSPYRIKANFPFYGVSSVAALGIGTSGGGVAYDRLDAWDGLQQTKWRMGALALLGADLHSTCCGTLEASTPNIAFGVPTTQYVALTVNSTTRSLSVDGHTHTKAGIRILHTRTCGRTLPISLTTFTPSSHTYTKSQITDFPTTWAWGKSDHIPSTFSPQHTLTVRPTSPIFRTTLGMGVSNGRASH